MTWWPCQNEVCLIIILNGLLSYKHTEPQRPMLINGDAWKSFPDPFPSVHWAALAADARCGYTLRARCKRHWVKLEIITRKKQNAVGLFVFDWLKFLNFWYFQLQNVISFRRCSVYLKYKSRRNTCRTVLFRFKVLCFKNCEIFIIFGSISCQNPLSLKGKIQLVLQYNIVWYILLIFIV